VKLARGGSIRFTNNDVMPHKLVKLSGKAVTFTGKPNMNHTSATLRVTFPKAGVYTFVTKAGEDYMQGVKTVGEDNVLRLRVTVS
jgi:plastocyanin